MSTDARTLEPDRVERPLGEIPFLFLPNRDLFRRRGERLRFLSKGHSLEEYLSFLAKLADAQQEAMNRFPPTALPGPSEIKWCREQVLPLLNARSWQRDPAWRDGLKIILELMSKTELPSSARETITSLLQTGESFLEETADRIVAEELAPVSPQELPFIAAALQVYWVQMASSLKEDAVGRLEQGGLCPVCGSHPNVGVVRGSGKEQGLRYLSCLLCSSQWHMVRIKCSACESTAGIGYHILGGSNGAVKVESCDGCNSYLKLLYLEKDTQMDVTADDLATLSLDMLMDKEGKGRGGPNLLFHPGPA